MPLRRSTSAYPPDWKQIAAGVKERSGWRCIRCGHAHDTPSGHMLGVHHLDMNPANCRWWNLVSLCQRCHLQIQHKVVLERPWLWEHSEWFKPYAAGWYASLHGLPDDEEFVRAHMDRLLDLGQLRMTADEFRDRIGQANIDSLTR